MQGIAALDPSSDVIVIVDVLSFSTCVDIAVGRGASVLPYPWRDASADRFAAEQLAILAQPRRSATAGFSLSPASLRSIPASTRLVLPSPNGATLSRATGTTPTIAGCLRNARAVARLARASGGRVSVIAAGERWPDGSLRPAIEDWLGAGAIIAHLGGARSPEAELACRAFQAAEHQLPWYLGQCGSGRELIERGYADDVALAAEVDVSDCAPLLHQGAYTRAESMR
jgi:2-phosphosulfolactate phosphatase